MRLPRRLAVRIFGRQEGSDEPVKWNLGWLGAVLVVAVIIGFVAYKFTLGRSNRDEVDIRNFYASARGGGAPRAVVRRIHVHGCDPYVNVPGIPAERCRVDFDGARSMPCFGFGVDGVEEKFLAPGCDDLYYDERRQTMAVRRHPQ